MTSIAFFFLCSAAVLQGQGDTTVPKKSGSVVVNPGAEVRSLEVLQGLDSTSRKNIVGGTTAPGKYPFSPAQDSAYYEALRLKIPAGTRLALLLPPFPLFERMPVSKRQELLSAIDQNMNISPAMFAPDAREQILYNYNLAQANYLPGVGLPFSEGFTPYQVSLQSIATFFGLTEDVSPNISYTLESSQEVEIIIYSTQAIAIATIFTGTQPAGSYSIEWNGRDKQGDRVLPGDYVAEVRIGKDKYVRKRIKI